jgi:hypothetical protein
MTTEGYINSLGCTAGTITLNLVVKPQPVNVPDFSVATDVDNGTATLTWTADENADKYVVEWFFRGDDVVQAQNELDNSEASYEIQFAGLDFEAYEYTFSIYSDYGCAVSDKSSISTELGGNTTHFGEAVFNKTNIWTANGTLYITNNNIENGAVTIYNLVGKPIATLKILSGETRSITIPQGIYLLKAGNKTVKIAL